MMRQMTPIHVVGIGGVMHPVSQTRAALDRALTAAEHAGATVDLLDVYEFDLPMLRPGVPFADLPPRAQDFIQRSRRADAMLWASAGYHGTLAGVTKNALDYLDYLRQDERPFLTGRVVGLTATAWGDQAQMGAISAMRDVVHALRAVAAPLAVPIAFSNDVFDADLNIIDERTAQRLDMLGEMVVTLAAQLRAVEASTP